MQSNCLISFIFIAYYTVNALHMHVTHLQSVTFTAATANALCRLMAIVCRLTTQSHSPFRIGLELLLRIVCLPTRVNLFSNRNSKIFHTFFFLP